MNFFKSLIHIFYPDVCIGCNNSLLSDEKTLCIACRHELPVLYEDEELKNKLNAVFFGRVPIKRVEAFLTYRKEGVAQKLIHELKYKGNQEIGVFLGNWFGKKLKDDTVFNDVDYIVPVPLHPTKKKTRGYNQLTKFGNSLSKELTTPYREGVLQRTSSTKTQTLKQRFERFSNTNTKFWLSDIHIFENKHVLLIDDVITTGATLEACCKELLKTKNITISIATIAYTERY